MVDVTKRPGGSSRGLESPPALAIDFTVRHLAGADWRGGDGFEIRDLGLATASHGLIGASHYRSLREGISLDWGRIQRELDVCYVFAGSMWVYRDETAELLQHGDCLYHGPGCTCRLGAISDDCELVGIRTEGREIPSTQEAHREALDAVGQGGPSSCHILSNDPEAYITGAGPRSFFGYRDFGADDVTNGRIHLHVVRAIADEAPSTGTGWHAHSMSQWYMVTRGEGNIDVAGHSRHQLLRGDCMTIDAYMAHDEFRYSSDYEVIQLCTPAIYETIAVDAP